MGEAYSHLSLEDRVEIEKGLDAKESYARIGARIGRPGSTVFREVTRNAWRPGNESAAYTPYRGQGRHRTMTRLQYRAGPAQRHAERRAANTHRPRLFTRDVVVGLVSDGLRRGWSPAMIAARAARAGIGVSHESIYAWIYGTRTRAAQWSPYLVRGHKRRRAQHGRRVHRSHIPFRVSIHDRPQVVEGRAEFGHWEGDTVLGAKTGRDGIHTEVERSTRYLMAAKVTDLRAATTAATQLGMFAGLPAHAARSVTLDNGAENHRHHQLDALAMPVYFADPYSSWQRGTNENLNGILRRYLPKGASLTGLTDTDLADIITEINNRPLKCLDWDTPAERFEWLCSNPHATVALQS